MYKFLENKSQTYLEDEITKEVVVFNGTKDEAMSWLESQYGHAASFFTPVLCGE